MEEIQVEEKPNGKKSQMERKAKWMERPSGGKPNGKQNKLEKKTKNGKKKQTGEKNL
ncbi:hypothetical protein PVIIG_01181 [Plasmodium vivax India VII]|uniref:Uncharacterized protein n=6 Tax=Plasmodium vivax TaxID=5855 RepID=A5K0F7_PLAVS|nr:hypothetical protein PVX_084320 [Plasmodium vivax]KMZ78403.1 hypothetical protein PVIIG_01181 [Plasmodium vivax India VII]KMZ83591.1 hypothetical protein PVBG_00671 [Plasmodium vivax Brazil I]KMZ91039.1 hypothetical protein PVMG_05868 [Plasmodium vivax Mauritania I]KMZ97576.1 hypothetical protein PVNG_01313 [Plasmodium vivax North Korean]EDL46804.1 hypothetical protein PVX_084320 [Plasmodium vivax]|eukprot:XP_001616531.1 hypothetical protein [Plasmodium vivax Sal-1]